MGGVIIISSKETHIDAMATEKLIMKEGTLSVQEDTPPCPESSARKLREGLSESKKSAEEMRKQIKDSERRIQAGKTKPMTDGELWDIDAKLRALKEVLLNDVTLHDPDCSDDEGYPLPGLRQVVDEQLSDLLMDEFGADLKNFRRTQKEFGLKLSLLLENHGE